MRLSVELRPRGERGELLLPLTVDGSPLVVADALAGVLEETARGLVGRLEDDYAGRLDAVFFTLRIDVLVNERPGRG